eukprot:TRINITY_DN1804_c0_g1_i2.p1 TRINITY_DN1804_c0_g1~~TRINITY_DN1804_c0_g1_i2.p1  ORF type:complete len:110 (+),score=7.64 TRINITY_DN1804_c0_g1_i2:340-669(+)
MSLTHTERHVKRWQAMHACIIREWAQSITKKRVINPWFGAFSSVPVRSARVGVDDEHFDETLSEFFDWVILPEPQKTAHGKQKTIQCGHMVYINLVSIRSDRPTISGSM